MIKQKRTNSHDFRLVRVAQGLCYMCGIVPHKENSRSCAPCDKMAAERVTTKRKKSIKNGLCGHCHKKPLFNKQLCLECRNKINTYLEQHREKAKKENMCSTLCGSVRVGNSCFCEKHYFSCTRRRYKIENTGSEDCLKVLFEKQNERCVFCNDKLILGINTELDHLLPKSKCPEKARDINNLAWTCIDCNQGKQNLTPLGFINMCLKVSRI